MNPIGALVNVFVIFAGALFAVMPEFSRPGILFGVTVAPEFRHTEQGRALLRGYRRSIIIPMLVILAIGIVVPLGNSLVPLQAGAAGLVAIACWIQASRQTRPFGQPHVFVRVASLTAPPRSLPGGLPFLFGPYLIFALAGLYLYLNWNSIPDVFPVHWGADGVPNGFARRTVIGVFGILLFGMGGAAITSLLACIIFFTTRNVRTADGEAVDDLAFRRGIYFVMLLISYVVSSVLSVVATRPVWASDPSIDPSTLIPGLFAIFFAMGLGILVYIFRAARARGGFGDGTPDERWHWGLFYYNPDDAALFVEKRMGIGWTLNFANKWAWACVGLTLVPAIGVLIFVGFLK